ncbi:MAG: DinB family protein [Anaerolineales bacterium]|nr:DinB family protein [Anaerolineales bacterium]
MISIQDLDKAFQRNLEIIKMQTENISQEDSLIQLPFRINCLNWVVGHVLTNRCNILNLLGAEDIRPEVNLDHYERESCPILGDESGVFQLDELLNHLDETQRRMSAALENETLESLQRLTPYRERTEREIGYWLFFLYYHDSYHVGQTEILRQAAGTEDKIT